jgi:hypothetical protein
MSNRSRQVAMEHNVMQLNEVADYTSKLKYEEQWII